MSHPVIPSERSDRGIFSNANYKPADARSLASARADRPFRAITALALAATPTFAVMALLSSVHGGANTDMHCSGMVTMYLLMSVFHLSPWLKLLTTRADTTR